MRSAEAWLRARVPGAPENLLELMVSALPATAATEPDALAEGAVRLYADVLAGTGGRADALPLLAADALLTHAFQLCAEVRPESLADFADRWGAAGRLAEVSS